MKRKELLKKGLAYLYLNTGYSSVEMFLLLTKEEKIFVLTEKLDIDEPLEDYEFDFIILNKKLCKIYLDRIEDGEIGFELSEKYFNKLPENMKLYWCKLFRKILSENGEEEDWVESFEYKWLKAFNRKIKIDQILK